MPPIPPEPAGTDPGTSNIKLTAGREITIVPTVATTPNTSDPTKPVSAVVEFSNGDWDWTGGPTPWKEMGYFNYIQFLVCKMFVIADDEAPNKYRWQAYTGTARSKDLLPRNDGATDWYNTTDTTSFTPHDDPIELSPNQGVSGEGGQLSSDLRLWGDNLYYYEDEKVYLSAVGYTAVLVCIKEWDGEEGDPDEGVPNGTIVAMSSSGNLTPLFGSQDNWEFLKFVTKPSFPLVEEQEQEQEDGKKYDLPVGSVKMEKMQTNLPIHNDSIASMRHPGPHGRVKWRNGIIHTWEETPADGAFDNEIPYGFRFHYNPATWGQSVSFTESINPDSIAKSNIDRLPLPGGFASISFKLYLNRIADLACMGDYYDSSESLKRIAEEQTNKYMGLTSGNPNNYGIPAVTTSATTVSPVNKHLQRILRQGTLYDLDYLYATANGANLGSYHVDGFKTPNPNYDNDFRSPDYGFISPRYVRIWLGPHVTFVGRINNISVQHLLFSQYMIPTFTEVTITIVRGLTFGINLEDSKSLYNDSYSSFGVVEPSSESSDTTDGGG
jgi:hypothetical protein